MSNVAKSFKVFWVKFRNLSETRLAREGQYIVTLTGFRVVHCLIIFVRSVSEGGIKNLKQCCSTKRTEEVTDYNG